MKKLNILFADPIGHVLGHHDFEICSCLAGRGHEILLATNKNYPFLGDKNNFRVITPFQNVVGDGSVIRKGFNYIISLGKIWNETRQFQPDLLIYYYVLQPVLERILISILQRSGIPVFLYVHDVFPLSGEKTVRKAYWKIYKEAHSLLTFSQYARNELINELNISPGKVHALFLAIDCQSAMKRIDTHQARELLGLPSADPVILCFGQIKRNKGLEYLLRAFAELIKHEPKAKLLVIGRPWKVNMERFYVLAQQLSIQNHVIFRPELIPEIEIQYYMTAADVVVLPYIRLYQSAVLPLACALGKPVIATRVGNIPEVLENGKTGYLLPPRNAAALKRALLKVLYDPAETKQVGLRAQQVMRDRYNWDVFGQDLAKIIERP